MSGLLDVDIIANYGMRKSNGGFGIFLRIPYIIIRIAAMITRVIDGLKKGSFLLNTR